MPVMKTLAFFIFIINALSKISSTTLMNFLILLWSSCAPDHLCSSQILSSLNFWEWHWNLDALNFQSMVFAAWALNHQKQHFTINALMQSFINYSVISFLSWCDRLIWPCHFLFIPVWYSKFESFWMYYFSIASSFP